MKEIKNAVITSASITTGDRGFLDAWLHLDYGGSGQGFGGYVLYLPKTFTHHKIESVAGHFIFRIMEIAEVTRWEDLKGKTIRVAAGHGRVSGIGHIVKDDWFYPEADFASFVSAQETINRKYNDRTIEVCGDRKLTTENTEERR